MARLFARLLRSNFRCGRMLNSRAVDMAGHVDAPIPELLGKTEPYLFVREL